MKKKIDITMKDYDTLENTMNSIGIPIAGRTFGDAMKALFSTWDTLTEDQKCVISGCFDIDISANESCMPCYSDVLC
mgnify:CR=1 FL=1